MPDTLFDPQTTAVVGASRHENKIGHAVLRNIIKYGYKSRIMPINPAPSGILGLKAYSRGSDVPSGKTEEGSTDADDQSRRNHRETEGIF